ncbi:hypothetical protein AAHA92_27144 [Salvia divinorum]|uniref:F-box domain-containing protein n=1 Tax=Salvia divinorum TaxID=28513 RepID=A0ABD1G5E8_SALDI
MEQDLFRNLPSEITTNILSRLPIRSISISKCVCKPWLNLLESDYFDFLKSKTKAPHTIVRTEPETWTSTRCTIWEFEDEDEVDLESHPLRFHTLTDIGIPHGDSVKSVSRVRQANGLLLLYPDIETERHIYVCNPVTQSFSTFSAPNIYGHTEDEGIAMLLTLHVFRDCLCLCYGLGEYFVIWSMREHQVEESWTIEYKIRVDCDYEFEMEDMYIIPIKIFKNGDILMFLEDQCLAYYSNKTRTIQRVGMFDLADTMIFTPSLFSLKKFGGENVISF